MRYRVNYGQGQVSGTFRTKREAFRHIAEDDDPRGSFVQFQDPDTGEWFSCGMRSRADDESAHFRCEA